MAALHELRCSHPRTKVVVFAIETTPGTAAEATGLGAGFVSKLRTLRALVDVAAEALTGGPGQPPFGSIQAR